MPLSKTNTSRNKPQEGLSQKGLQSFLYGKLPPQNIELEKAVLGAIMLEKGAFDTIAETLHPKCFYETRHQYIFEAFVTLNQALKPIDILTVSEQLKAEGQLEDIGGSFYLMSLTQDVVSTGHLEAHSRVVLEKFIQRELMEASSEIISKSSETLDNISELMDFAEDKIFNITQSYVKGDYKQIGQVLINVKQRIQELQQSTEKISGVYSSFPSLDSITHGWQQTDLIILAARPSVGKTAFALNLALNAAKNASKPVPVGLFSLEMSSEQLVQRLLANESEVSLTKITGGTLAPHEVAQINIKGIDALSKIPIYIDDNAALNSFELRSKVRRMVNKHKVGLVIIDYLQLMQASGEKSNYNREQEISKISRDLKGLAKDLKIPIIALSQLNRMVETRKENKIPQLSDLRESGAIEQDADLVMFLYRQEMYEQPQDGDSDGLRNATFLKIAKHRNGGLTDGAGIQFHFEGALQRFKEESSGRTSQWESPVTGRPFPPPHVTIHEQNSIIKRSSVSSKKQVPPPPSTPDFIED